MGQRPSTAVVLLAGALAGACGHRRAVAPAPPAEPARPTAVAPQPPDPVAERIARAEAALAEGLAESRAGHLNAARAHFDRALDELMTAEGGALADSRLAESYRRTLEAIQAQEVDTLGEGDAYSEPEAEPAPIDAVGDLPVAEVPPSEEVRQVTAEAIEEEVNDLPIELNDPVLAAVDLYRGPLREWFAEALARGASLLPHIRAVFAAEGIPQDLAYTALVESAFKPTALSRARAKGVWQFIPSTGRRFGLKQDWWVDERSHPDKATRAAAQYLKLLHGMFQDWNLALAAYNAGEGKVLRGIKRYKTRDFWRLARTRAFRRETRNYVPMIHAAVVVAKAADRYGFSTPPVEAPAVDSVPIQGAVDLRVVAECASSTVGELRSLNPELRRLATPANRTYDLHVPAGQGGALAACLEALPADKRVTFRTHLVARGQTFSSLAKRYGAQARDIAEANGLSVRSRLPVGRELIIPVRPPGAAASPAVRAASRAYDSDAGERIRIVYRVRRGDTLGAIASRYNTTVRELQQWNGLRGTRIAAGRRLTVFARRAD
jgi:membrane-bound lytic murein transglycosylase D